jgi:hypothetical protein
MTSWGLFLVYAAGLGFFLQGLRCRTGIHYALFLSSTLLPVKNLKYWGGRDRIVYRVIQLVSFSTVLFLNECWCHRCIVRRSGQL